MAEELGVLKVSLGLDDSDFSGTLKQVDAKLRAAQSEFKATASSVDGYGKSLDGMKTKHSDLSKQLELQQQKASALKAEYERVSAEFGKNSVQAQKMLTRYNNVITTINRTESQIKSLSDEIEKQENKWHQLSVKLDESSQKMSAYGTKMKDVGGALSVGITAPLTAATVAVGMIASQFEDATTKIQTSLGLTAEEANKLGDVAEKVWGKGFGDSLEEVTNALVRVKQNMKGIADGADLEKATRDAIILANTFDSDVNEVTRAANNLMLSFGVSSADAFDMLARGAQDGLNFSNELFDNVAEYSSLWASAGYSMEDYFDIMKSGTSESIYNLDYVNDLLKEFNIRIKDNSDQTSDYMSLLTQDTLDLWEAQYQGKATVADVAKSVIKDLQAMDNQVDANEIGVALFGTKWEDLESDAVYAMFNMEHSIGNVTGAMNKMAEAQEQTFSQRWQSLLRDAQLQLEPFGHTVLDIAEEWLPKLSAGLERVTSWFAEMDEESQELVVTLAGIAAAAGPLLVGGGIIASGASSVLNFASALSEAAIKGGALSTVMGVMTGPAGWAVLGVGAVATLAVGIAQLRDETEMTAEEMLKLQEESFNVAATAYEEANALNELASEYESLRDKSNLTTVSMLEFLDIQNELSTVTSPDKIAELTDRQKELIEKSGLTNEEFARMLELDGELQTSVEGVMLAFDSKGNAVIKYSDAVKDATNAQLELAKAELAATMMDNLFNLGEAQEKIAVAAEKQKEAYNESLRYLDEMKVSESAISTLKGQISNIDEKIAENERFIYESTNKRKDIAAEIKSLQEQSKSVTGEEREIIQGKIEDLRSELDLLRDQTNERESAYGALQIEREEIKQKLIEETKVLEKLQSQHDTHFGIYEEQKKEIANLNKQITLTNNQYNQYMDILAKEVGITAEQGKQLQQMKNLHSDNSKLIAQLEQKKKTEQGITAEEQRQLEELRKHNSQIADNIAEAEELNVILGKDITKGLTVDDRGAISDIDRRLSNPVTKFLNIIERGATPEYAYADGTNYHPGGKALVGEEGFELALFPGGKQVMLGVDGPEIANLPTGTKVKTHDQTKQILGDLSITNANLSIPNIRSLEDGGIMNRPTIFGAYGNSILAGEARNKAKQLNDKTLGAIVNAINKTARSGDIVQHITFEGKVDSPSENARKFKQSQRQLAMEWGV